ncbi:hypothetical protein [Accumulibacter sp.]|nr:hypothetical protein [Accumulibacter sp.]MCM8624377.1 hypothetical protein [Accumulibacter sp.]
MRDRSGFVTAHGFGPITGRGSGIHQTPGGYAPGSPKQIPDWGGNSMGW